MRDPMPGAPALAASRRIVPLPRLPGEADV
jgi:hypothetical protein